MTTATVIFFACVAVIWIVAAEMNCERLKLRNAELERQVEALRNWRINSDN